MGAQSNIWTFSYQFMVTGLPGVSGVIVPSRAVVVSRDADDHVQIHLLAMADEIALKNQRRCGHATSKGAQVTWLTLHGLCINKIENNIKTQALE